MFVDSGGGSGGGGGTNWLDRHVKMDSSVVGLGWVGWGRGKEGRS